jgi:putative DNA primase/helicase
MSAVRTAPDKPKVLAPRFGAIPQELGRRDQWAVWPYEMRDGKWTKPPYSARGSYAKSNDPSTWLMFFEARQLYEGGNFDGIGYMMSAEDPYSGIDLDDCRNPETGEIAGWAQQIVDRFHSYTEVTPSGTGLRIWIRGKLPGRGRRKGSVEVYSNVRFLAVTGHHLDGMPTTIKDRQTELDAFMAKTFGSDQSSAGLPTPQREPVEITSEDEQAIQERRERDERFETLWAGDTSAYPSPSEADLALCNMLKTVLGPAPAKIDAAFRKSGLYRKKWDGRHGGQTYGQMTIAKALSDPLDTLAEPGMPATDRQSEESTDAPTPSPRFVLPNVMTTLYGVPIALPYFDDEKKRVVTESAAPWVGGSRLLGEFVALARDLAPGLDEDWAIMALLAGVSVLVPEMRFENLGLNLWMLGIAAQSTGKGLVLDAVETVMREAAKVLPRAWFTDVPFSSDDLISGRSPLRTFTSGSPQGMLHLGQHGPVLAVFEEASAFMEQAERLDAQAGIKQVFCQLYDGRRISHQLRDKSGIVEIERPHVAMLAAINKADFSRVFTPQDFRSGFLSRMLVVAADYHDLTPRRVPEKTLFRALGQRLGEHLAQFEDVVYVRFGKRRLAADDLRRLSGRLVTGEDLLWSMLRTSGLTSGTGQVVDLDAPQDDGDLETPRGREIARVKKLAALFELLEDAPNVQTFETGDRLPTGAKVGDQYLGVRDQNILRALTVVLRSRAYGHRAMRWLSTSEDVAEQAKIVRVITKSPGIAESVLMKSVRSRGAVYMKRNLEMLERSGEILKVPTKNRRGVRYYPGDWPDEEARGKPQ